ncbi:MAG: DUF1287 domain-containing protein [Alphaproteobacteria bacterium]|nr:DUF1287 domain-containing protein [Alphaproteobacteria bacterium]
MRTCRVAAFLFAVAAPSAAQSQDFGALTSAAAIERTHHRVFYDPSYVPIAYPGGDVAPDRGVCADVVIRALRAAGLDLQKAIHEDMAAHFDAYPHLWGLAGPDANIDHRRVPNIERFLTRKGWRLPPSRNPGDYQPGDIVAWNLRGRHGYLPHIGVVTDRIAPSGRPLIVHNIGAGPKLEDVLFSWPITGRFRISDSQAASAHAR